MKPTYEELAYLCQELWGLLLAADGKTRNRYINAAFRKADERVRQTGLTAVEITWQEERIKL